MSSVLALLLLSGLLPVVAQGPGDQADGGQGRARGPDTPDQNRGFQEDPSIPKDQGWRKIGVGGPPYEENKPDPAPALGPEDVRGNVLTLLETYLGRTDGRWVLVDSKTKRTRRLKLVELGELTETASGLYAGRARFRDKTGVVQAELAARLGGSRWRVVSLEPVGAKRLSKSKPAVEPAEGVLLETPDAPKPHELPPAPPPPDPSPPPSMMPTVPPGK